jgi:hypothetical protein
MLIKQVEKDFENHASHNESLQMQTFSKVDFKKPELIRFYVEHAIARVVKLF